MEVRPHAVPAIPSTVDGRRADLATHARRLAAAGDHPRAIVAAREALRAQPADAGQPLHELLGVCLREQGRYAQARRHLSVGLTQAIASGDAAAEARTLQLLGIVAREQGRYAEAARLLARAEALYCDLGDVIHQACLLLSSGELLLRAGQPQARRDVADGLTRCRELGSGFGVAYGLRLLGEAEMAERRVARAVPLLREAVHLSSAINNPFLLAVALRSLAQAQHAAGHPAAAAATRSQATAILTAIGSNAETR
jgi:tetratricopeptide (TPR) repeat protein